MEFHTIISDLAGPVWVTGRGHKQKEWHLTWSSNHSLMINLKVLCHKVLQPEFSEFPGSVLSKAEQAGSSIPALGHSWQSESHHKTHNRPGESNVTQAMFHNNASVSRPVTKMGNRPHTQSTDAPYLIFITFHPLLSHSPLKKKKKKMARMWHALGSVSSDNYNH